MNATIFRYSLTLHLKNRIMNEFHPQLHSLRLKANMEQIFFFKYVYGKFNV